MTLSIFRLLLELRLTMLPLCFLAMPCKLHSSSCLEYCSLPHLSFSTKFLLTFKSQQSHCKACLLDPLHPVLILDKTPLLPRPHSGDLLLSQHWLKNSSSWFICLPYLFFLWLYVGEHHVHSWRLARNYQGVAYCKSSLHHLLSKVLKATPSDMERTLVVETEFFSKSLNSSSITLLPERDLIWKYWLDNFYFSHLPEKLSKIKVGMGGIYWYVVLKSVVRKKKMYWKWFLTILTQISEPALTEFTFLFTIKTWHLSKFPCFSFFQQRERGCFNPLPCINSQRRKTVNPNHNPVCYSC